ncbi:hypothetical protein ABPG72_008949 [Tetrahymena utriculariae]
MSEESIKQEEIICCIGFLKGKNIPANFTSSLCFVSIQKFLLEQQNTFKSIKCVSIYVPKKEQYQISIQTVEDVQEKINEIKKSINFEYLSIPPHLKDERFRIKDKSSNIQEGQQPQDEDSDLLGSDTEFLKNFISKETDDANQKEEIESFNKIKSFCQTVFLNSQGEYQQEQKEDTKQQNWVSWIVILTGTEKDLIALHGKDGQKIEVKLKNENSYHFFLKTLHQDKNLKICTEELSKNAKEQLNFVNMKLLRVGLGIFELYNSALYYSSLFQFEENTNNVNSISIFMQNDESESKQKQQSVSIVLAYKDYQLKMEFPYLYCNEIRQQLVKQKQYYFTLVVPPKYYVRENSPNIQENLDSKKNTWTRVDNFFALNIDNELKRIEFVNNTVISIEIENEINESFQKILKQSFSNVFKDNCSMPISNVTNSFPIQAENDLDYSWERLLKNYSFNLSYSILTLISHNKLSVVKLKEFLDYIDRQKQLGKSEYILEKGIEYYYNQKNQIDRLNFAPFITIFKDVQRQENYLKIQESRAKRDVKVLATRRVSITPSGLIYNLKELELSNRVLRIFQDSTDQFIRGTFQDDSLENAKHMKYVSMYFRQKLKSFTILDWEFVNFGWSASQLRNSSSWFFHETEALKKQDVITRIGDFSGISPPAKKSARIGQCFSSSTPYVLKERPNIEFIDDITTPSAVKEVDHNENAKYFKVKKPKVFTDGIGTISQDLIRQISDHLNSFFMSAIQVRYGGAKGVLTIDYKSNKKNTIQLRDSMIKYKITDEEDELIIDILDRNKYRFGYLNRQVIILLRSLGIQNQHFIQAQEEYIEELNKSALKDANIFTLFNNDYSKDGTRLIPITHLLRSMQTSRIDMAQDIFCKGIIHTLKKRGFYILRKKSNIFLKKSARLMGVIDEYNVLEQDEVFAYISQDSEKSFFQVEGDVIVVKNPCLHPGDIRKLKAVTLETISQRLGEGQINPFKKLRNILIFPSKGKEPITSQIAGSDLDGDCYFICWDQRFIPLQQKEPFNYDQDENGEREEIKQEEYEKEIKQKPNKIIQFKTKNPVKENVDQNDQMLDFFIDFLNNENLGKIDNSHLVFADKSPLYAEDPNCLKLASLHAKAVDYAKSGYSPKLPKNLAVKEYPDFMEKDDKPSYQSQSILGILYRQVKDQYEKHCKNDIEGDKSQTFIDKNLIFNPPTFTNQIVDEQENKTYLQQEIDFAIEANNQWNIEINNLKQFFGAQNEFEIYTGNFSKLIKVERKKKMSAEIVQQRILSTLLAIKNRFELMFFKNIDEDRERFYDETNRKKYYSKKCKIRATIWYIICYLRKPEHVDKYKADFEKDSLLGQAFSFLSEKAYYGEQIIRGARNLNTLKFFNENNDYVGLSWFIISNVLLEIKRDNDSFKMNEQKQQKNEDQKKEFESYKKKFFQNNIDGNQSDEYL